MQSEYTQQLRYKLQKRVRRLNSARYEMFHFHLVQLWQFLQNNQMTKGVMDQLVKEHPTARATVKSILENNEEHLGNTEDEHATLALLIIQHSISLEDHGTERDIAMTYSREGRGTELQAIFYETFVEPLYEYIDEHLDDQRAILAHLRRYKHKCEWFQRDHLQKLIEDGEKTLAKHLYEYLFDQGIEFSIEPWSASGEADLISAQNTDDPLVADVKIFDPGKSKTKSYILSGFRQVYTYTLDYNEPFGYLVIYNNSGKDLSLASPETEQGTALFTHNNKTIFVLMVDIYEYENTASKRGKLETITISEDDLITIITDNKD